MSTAPPPLRTPLYSLTSAATPELSIRSRPARSTVTRIGLVATIRSISSASWVAVLISSEPRTVSLVSAGVRWTSNGVGTSAPRRSGLARHAFAQAPQVGWTGFVGHLVQHRLGYVNAHPALRKRLVIELGRQRRDASDVERSAVVFDLDDQLVAAGLDRDLDRPAALALVCVDRD